MLEKELEIYNKLKEELLEKGNEGKFVVIKGEEVLDIFTNYEDALRQGLKRYGNTPFLIKEITQFEEINYFHHGVDLPCQASA